MEKKFELTDETKCFGDILVHRIRALKDFNDVEKGDLGGFVEKEKNLSHEGSCWIYDDASVLGSARIMNSTMIKENALVKNNAIVDMNALIRGRALIGGDAIVSGNDEYDGIGVVIEGFANISDRATIKGKITIGGRVRVDGNAHIILHESYGIIDQGEHFGGNASIGSRNDWFSVNNMGSRHDTITFYINRSGSHPEIECTTGCFTGTIDKFVKAVIDRHGYTYYAREYLAIVDVARNHFYFV